MKSTNMIILLVATLVFSASCATEKSNSGPNKLSDELNVNTDDINSTILLVDSAEMANTHINGSLLSLKLINQSTETINFNGNYDLKLITQKSGDWIDVSNGFYYPDSLIKLLSAEQDPVGLTVNITPYIGALTELTKIRIIVSGIIDSKNTLVVAYTDVIISP
ncbi:MAG: hypothetical protein JNM55_10320 [Anaerolineales bacterium]|nr:hypothetical protein [Anaerolineales bacterium]